MDKTRAELEAAKIIESAYSAPYKTKVRDLANALLTSRRQGAVEALEEAARWFDNDWVVEHQTYTHTRITERLRDMARQKREGR